MRETLKFIAWPAIAGVLAALLILDRWVLPAETGQDHSHGATASYSSAVNRAAPAVVNIYTAKLVSTNTVPLFPERFRRLPRQRIERSLGSGVIMSKEGHILTNLHVIAGADAIQVLLHDGRTANAVVIGSDSATDLAVLKIDLPDLIPAKLADSDKLRVGDVVLAIGNPLGFGHSVTQGIVSGLGRWGLQLNTYEDYIQTDAMIHQGNSGGALVDAEGRLVGINTLIYTSNTQAGSGTGIGISLAIPSNLAVYVMQDLIDYGEVIRGWLGVSVEPVQVPGSNQQQALLVIGVAESSPAERAGLQVGDVITQIDGKLVVDGRQTMHKIARLRPGESVGISVQRDQQSLELRAVVGAQGQQSPAG
ncbi:S1C family serine protease [Haliea sp. E17]|uniref:S1C family serine protease n=1 Tax=Haliea sp. E17 TaxID=3401576 RepID=UPI003AAA2257